MKYTQDRRSGRRIWALALSLWFLLVLVILLSLRGCTLRGIYEGKIQSPINDTRPLAPSCVVELLSVDGNGDGVPDYQQVDEIEPRTDYDRDVLAALSWLNGHINNLDKNGNYQDEPPANRDAPAITPPVVSLPPLLEHDGLSGAGSSTIESSQEPQQDSDSSASTSSLVSSAPELPEASGSESSEPDTWWSPAYDTSAAPTVTGIRVETPPTKTEYIEGESFDPAGISVVMVLSNGTTKPVTAFQYSTEPLTIGMTAITITMPTGTKNYAAEVPITLREKKLLEIHVTPPGKEYIEGQIPAPGDFAVFGDYDNGKSEPVPEATIKIPDKPLTDGQTEIGITVMIGGRTETITIPITVNRKRPVELIVTHGPNQSDYIAGQVFSPEGLTVMVRYDNDSTSDINDYTVSPGGLTEGQTTTEIAYTENGATVTAQIRVTVRPESLVDATIHSMPDKTDYPEGVPFVPDGLVLDCKYDNGKTEARTDYTFSGAALCLGATKFPVAITHRDVTLFVDIPITVRPTIPESVSVRSNPEDMVQEAGTKLDLSGMELEIAYDNGTTAAVPATDSRVELSNGKRHFDRIDPVTGFAEYPLADCIFTDNGVTAQGTENPDSSRLKITPYLSQLALRLSDTVPYYKVGHPIGPTGLVAEFNYISGDSVETPPCDPNSPADEVMRLLASGLARLEYEETTATNEGTGDKPVTVTLVPSPKFLNTEESAVQVQVAPLLPDKLEVVTLPSKTEYINDEAFTPEEMKLKATMNNDETRELSPSTPGVELGYESGTSFIPMPEGSPILKYRNETNIVRYSYNGKTVTVPFELSIADETPERLTRKGSFEGKSFIENLPFTPGEIGYTVRLSNGKTLEIPYGNASKSAPAPGQPASTAQQGYTAQTAPAPGEKLIAGTNAEYGENTACFSFSMNGETIENEFAYELQHRRVESIEAVPTKQYVHGETIRPADFRVTLHWNNGETSTADPANVTVSRSEAVNTTLTQATNTVTIGLRDVLAIGTPTASINVTVKAPIPTSLQVTAPPTKTQYISGTKFDPAGLKLQAAYSNGATSEVLPGGAGVSIDTVSELPFGAASVQADYTYNSASVSVSIPITVIHETPTVIQVISPPNKTAYVVGNTLDLTGLSIQAALSNGKTVILPFNAAGVACAPAHGAVLKAADHPVTVSYSLWGVTKQTTQALSISQYVTCSSCGGSGSRSCSSCGGDGRVTKTCSSCGGSGHGSQIWVCGKCGETRTGSRPSSVHAPCAPEGGWYSGGYTNCSSCGGSGSKTSSCSSCGGSGDRTCSTCGGSGRVLAGANNATLFSDEPLECKECVTDESEEPPFQAVTYGSEAGTVTTSDSISIPVDVYYALPDGETDPENAVFFVRFSHGERVRFDGLSAEIEICYIDERLHLTYRDNGRWVTRIYPLEPHSSWNEV